MAGGLTLEQMKFLAAKGLSIEDAIAFAEMGKTRSKAAERTARWRARKNVTVTENVTCDGHGDASPPPREEFIPPVSSDEETKPPVKSKRAPAKSDAPAKPEGVKDQTWADFLKVRAKKRAPMTETALVGIEAEARKAGWSMEAALAKCAVKGWQSFEADWVSGKPPDPGGNSNEFLRHMMAKQAANA